MASQAERNAVGALVMVECTMRTFDAAQAKTVRALCDRVSSLTNTCFSHWTIWSQNLDVKEEKKRTKEMSEIHRRIQDFDTATFNNRPHATSVYTSLLLGILDPIARQVSGTRKLVMDQLLAAIKALHRYYDRKLNRWEEYTLVGRYLESW